MVVTDGLEVAPPVDLAHREPDPAVGQYATVVDGDDSWMLKLRSDLGFLDEPRDHRRVLEQP